MRTPVELEEAVSLIVEGISPLGAETVDLAACPGRTLASGIIAPLDQPPFDRSPLDGYALRAADLTGADAAHPALLRVADTLCAGDVARIPVGRGEAVRIMTGAMLPAGADCVVRQEDTDRGFPAVRVSVSLRPFENFCPRGEDCRSGVPLLSAGTLLDAAAVGVLAGVGIRADIPVRRRPRAAILTTGDEVVSPGTHPLPPGKIYGSNLHLLTARLHELGVPLHEALHVPDDPRAAADAIARLCAGADLVVTTGGVSEGDKDILRMALPLLGAERVFWRVRAKPGTPAMFSRWRGKPILSLSGNPFAAAATFELLARPLLAALAGEPRLLPVRVSAILRNGFPKASPVRRFLRGRYEGGGVTLPERHGSGLLVSSVGCNCLVDIPAGSGVLEAGTGVEVLLL